MKPVDDQFFIKRKKKTHFMLCKRRDSHEAFERDHAAQLSVGFHAKQANLILHC